MAQRSIFAQIDEVRELLDQHGRESIMAEHKLRLECVLKTLEWVRDNQDELKVYMKQRRSSK